MTEKYTTFLIWDTDDKPPEGNWTPILWRSYGGGEGSLYSMPEIIEERADALRQRYLSWIYVMGESCIKGKRLVDHLELRPGFSYWWMTLLAEKSNAYKSPQIVDALKLLALEDLIADHSVAMLVVESNNKRLVKTIRKWCRDAGLLFKLHSLQKAKVPESRFKRIYHSLPYPMQSIISLARYIWQRWSLKQDNGCQNEAESKDLTFVDYLIHLDPNAFISGRFASNFWTDLIDALDRSGSRVNWLHHYIQHEAVSSTKKARDLMACFNQSGMGQQHHSCLDAALSISVVLAAIVDYIRLVWISLSLNKVKRQFSPAESRLDFWPLFKQDWLNSMRGPTAIWNCLCLNIFEVTLKRLTYQKMGFYLQENQGWEMAFIHAWHMAGHGCLIGLPHASVRYWDLRYFYESKSYVRTGKNDLPLPDKVALNGPAALAAYRKEGYPEDQILEVEALRYLHLSNQSHIKTGANESLSGPLRILILGDYLPTVTHQQMQLIMAAAPLLPSDTNYVVKPHPNCPIKVSNYPSLHLHLAISPLNELLVECNVAYTSNITSAAVDAYCKGVPVVAMLDGNTLNMSPLRGMDGVMYVTNPAELADALRNTCIRERMIAEPYFCLEKGLPRWRQLLMDYAQCESVGLMEHV